MIGALLAEMNEQWQARRYLDMDEFNEWLAEQESKKSNVLELNQATIQQVIQWANRWEFTAIFGLDLNKLMVHGYTCISISPPLALLVPGDD